MSFLSKRREVIVGGMKAIITIKNGQVRSFTIRDRTFLEKSFGAFLSKDLKKSLFGVDGGVEIGKLPKNFISFLEKSDGKTTINLDNRLYNNNLEIKNAISGGVLILKNAINKHGVSLSEPNSLNSLERKELKRVLESGLIRDKNLPQVIEALNRPFGLKGAFQKSLKAIADFNLKDAIEGLQPERLDISRYASIDYNKIINDGANKGATASSEDDVYKKTMLDMIANLNETMSSLKNAFGEGRGVKENDEPVAVVGELKKADESFEAPNPFIEKMAKREKIIDEYTLMIPDTYPEINIPDGDTRLTIYSSEDCKKNGVFGYSYTDGGYGMQNGEEYKTKESFIRACLNSDNAITKPRFKKAFESLLANASPNKIDVSEESLADGRKELKSGKSKVNFGSKDVQADIKKKLAEEKAKNIEAKQTRVGFLNINTVHFSGVSKNSLGKWKDRQLSMKNPIQTNESADSYIEKNLAHAKELVGVGILKEVSSDEFEFVSPMAREVLYKNYDKPLDIIQGALRSSKSVSGISKKERDAHSLKNDGVNGGVAAKSKMSLEQFNYLMKESGEKLNKFMNMHRDLFIGDDAKALRDEYNKFVDNLKAQQVPDEIFVKEVDGCVNRLITQKRKEIGKVDFDDIDYALAPDESMGGFEHFARSTAISGQGLEGVDDSEQINQNISKAVLAEVADIVEKNDDSRPIEEVLEDIQKMDETAGKAKVKGLSL